MLRMVESIMGPANFQLGLRVSFIWSLCANLMPLFKTKFQVNVSRKINFFIYVYHMYMCVYVGLSRQTRIWLSHHQ